MSNSQDKAPYVRDSTNWKTHKHWKRSAYTLRTPTLSRLPEQYPTQGSSNISYNPLKTTDEYSEAIADLFTSRPLFHSTSMKGPTLTTKMDIESEMDWETDTRSEADTTLSDSSPSRQPHSSSQIDPALLTTCPETPAQETMEYSSASSLSSSTSCRLWSSSPGIRDKSPSHFNIEYRQDLNSLFLPEAPSVRLMTDPVMLQSFIRRLTQVTRPKPAKSQPAKPRHDFAGLEDCPFLQYLHLPYYRNRYREFFRAGKDCHAGVFFIEDRDEDHVGWLYTRKYGDPVWRRDRRARMKKLLVWDVLELDDEEEAFMTWEMVFGNEENLNGGLNMWVKRRGSVAGRPGPFFGD